MIRRAFHSTLIVLSILAIVVSCSRTERSAQTTSDTTIAPPAPKPGDTGTDAMTQTLEVEGSRSEVEGGVVTSSNPPANVPGTGTVSKTTTTKVEKKTGSTKARPPGATQ